MHQAPIILFNSNELTELIRNAIKQKLMELGDYVDDTLPDYIMIMLVNKKTEKQMADDLNLFLSSNSAKFSAWLHTYLKEFKENESTSSKTSSSKSNNEKQHRDHKRDDFHEINNNSESYELAIQIDSNEFNEEENTTELTNRNKSKNNDDSIINEIANKVKEKKIAIEKRKQEELKMREQLIKNKKNNENKNNKEKQNNNNRSKSTASNVKSTIGSKVGAIIKHNENKYTAYSDEDDDENSNRYNPNKPMISNTLSVIKVPERKYTVPKSLQPNKSILLKAVSDANNSIQQSTTHRKSISEETNGSNVNAKSTDSNTHSIKSRLGPLNREDTTASTNRNYSRIQLRVDNDNIDHDNSDDVDNSKRTIEVNDNNRDTRFIVTLKGINEKEFLSNNNDVSMNDDDEDDDDGDEFEDEDYNRNYTSLKRRLSDDDEDEDVEMNEDDLDENNDSKRRKIRCAYWPSCDKGDKCPYVHPNKQCDAFPNCPFGTKCHFIHPSCRFDGHCTRFDCPYTHLTKRSTVATPVTLLSTSLISPTTPIVKPIIYLPKSAPVTPIAAAKLYKKPTSKKHLYKINHSSSSTNNSKYVINHKAAVEPAKKEIECKFGMACKNVNCTFSHPKLPAKAALKWTATTLQSNTSSNTNTTTSTVA